MKRQDLNLRRATRPPRSRVGRWLRGCLLSLGVAGAIALAPLSLSLAPAWSQIPTTAPTTTETIAVTAPIGVQQVARVGMTVSDMDQAVAFYVPTP